MITWEDLNTGDLSGRKDAYSGLPSYRVQQSIPFLGATPLNDKDLTPVQLLAEQDTPAYEWGPEQPKLGQYEPIMPQWLPLVGLGVLAVYLLTRKEK